MSCTLCLVVCHVFCPVSCLTCVMSLMSCVLCHSITNHVLYHVTHVLSHILCQVSPVSFHLCYVQCHLSHVMSCPVSCCVISHLCCAIRQVFQVLPVFHVVHQGAHHAPPTHNVAVQGETPLSEPHSGRHLSTQCHQHLLTLMTALSLSPITVLWSSIESTFPTPAI